MFQLCRANTFVIYFGNELLDSVVAVVDNHDEENTIKQW